MLGNKINRIDAKLESLSQEVNELKNKVDGQHNEVSQALFEVWKQVSPQEPAQRVNNNARGKLLPNPFKADEYNSNPFLDEELDSNPFTDEDMDGDAPEMSPELELIEAHSDNAEGHVCPECRKSFQHAHTLRRHRATKHVGGEVISFDCDQCDRRYQWEGSLLRHKRASHG